MPSIFFHKDGIKGDHAYGTLVRYVLPAPLSGFFAAVMVGAILNSFNSVLNSTCTLFSLGVYKDLLKKNATDQEVVASGKIFGVIVAVLAMFVAPLLAKTASIFTYLQHMNSVYSTPLLAVVVVALWSKKAPAFTAFFAIIVGCVLMIIGVLVPMLIHTFHYSGIVFAVLILFMLLAAKFWPSDKQVPVMNPVDMKPWKFARLMGCALIVLAFVIFIVLVR